VRPPRLYTRLYVYKYSAVLALFYGWPSGSDERYDTDLELLAMVKSYAGGP